LPLTRSCSRCGAPNPPASKFCGECGERLVAVDTPAAPSAAAAESGSQSGDSAGRSASSAASATIDDKHPPRFAPAERVAAPASLTVPSTANVVEGERKTVTALFADIKGSTELMEDLDPEEAQALVDPALRLMIEAVRHFDGYIVQSTGDGIFALFGAPVAHEDHPQRALYAALRMQDELRSYGARLRAEGRPPIEIRVGVNTGEVVVRSIQTGARHAEYTPIGHTANLAARLQSIASTGSIVVSKDTERIVAGYFTLRPLGPVRIRGISDPVEVFEVAGVGPLRTRLQAAAMRGLSKFVGRAREVGKLMAALEAAKGGHGQIVAAVGDAGVGKSRLFYEFKAAAASGAMTLEAYSVSHGKASAYLPVIELLNDYFSIAPEDDRRRRREKIGGKILMLDRALEDTLPFLFALLGVQEGVVGGAGEGDDPLAGMDAPTRRRCTLKAIERILLRESLNQPLIVVFEDLHWIDSATQELLDLMAESVAGARILMLVNYRPEYQHRWSDKPCYTELSLGPLGSAGADQLLDALLDGGGEAPPALVSNGASRASRTALAELKRFIIDKTEGNPFFMEEMVRALFEHGAIKRDGALEIAMPLDDIRIPPTVNGILAARIDRLSADEKELLQTLAVVGKEFSLGLAKRVAPPALAERIESMLTDLQCCEFVFEEPATGESKYYFKHALTQEVAYNSLLAERRRLLHERAAGAIESLYAACLSDHVAELAYHYSRSANAAKAVEYLERAGQQARVRSAYSEAITHFFEGLALLDHLPVGEERQRMELSLQLGLAQSLAFTRGYEAPEVARAIDRAKELAELLNDSRIVPVMVLRRLGHFLRLELRKATEIDLRLIEMAQRMNNDTALAMALQNYGQDLFFAGELVEARARLERGAGLAKSFRISREQVNVDVRAVALSHLAMVLWTLGYPEQALARSREAVAAAHASQHRYSIGISLCFAGRLGVYLRDPVMVREAADAAIALTDGEPLWIVSAMARIDRGWARVLEGDGDDGIAEIQDGLKLWGSTIPKFMSQVYVEALCAANRCPEATAVAENALAASAEERASLPGLHLVKGELILKLDPRNASGAEQCFRTSIEIARAQQARSWELRAATALARLLDLQGRGDEARRMLAEIYGWFTEGFETRDLKDARALLDRFTDRSAPTPPG